MRLVKNPSVPALLLLAGMAMRLGAAPSTSLVSPAASSTVGTLTSLSVTFSEAVSGVNAGDLLIDGTPASTMTGSGAGPYVFSFTEPPPGTISVDWTDDHGIAGLGTGAFAPGPAWSYTLEDNQPPAIDKIRTSVAGQEIKHVFPTPSSTVSSLTQATVYFNEPVSGVDAADLRINGVSATAVTGNEAGPYVFSFSPPANGSVNFTWQASTGIIDDAGNPFAAEIWSVTKAASLGTVVITEFLAANAGASSNTANGTRDENFDLSPWIELQNTGASSVDLTGWSLTNDPDDPDMWILPSRNLAAGARLIVWAGGKDRKPPSGHLHANFELAVNGGYLALHHSNHPRSAPVSRFPADYPATEGYPPQRYDYSYGPQAGDGALRYFTPPSINQSSYTLPTAGNPSPTPPAEPQGAANPASALTSVAPKPTSNVSRGFFTAPFAVILSCERSDAVIRYTTNGSLPTAANAAYSAPITINGTTVLRFTSFASDSIPSETVTQTYLFADSVVNQNSPPYFGGNPQPSIGNDALPVTWGTQSGFGFPGLITNLAANEIPADYGMDPKIHADPNRYDDDGNLNASGKTNLERIHDGLRSLPVLSVVLKSDDMFGSGGIYPTSSSTNKADNTKPCSLEMFDAVGNTVFQSDAGIDNHGNASRDPYKNPKHGFTLRFKGRYGNGRLEGGIFPDSPVTKWDKLILRADFGFTWLHWDGSAQRPRGIRVRDPYCKDSFRDMGRMAGHNRFVNLFINGVYWGTYDLAEDEDEDFAASYFGGEKDSYDVIEQNALKSGSWTTYREIKRILGWTGSTYGTAPSSTKLASAFTNANYEEIKQHLDVPWICDYMILHYFVGHEDWGTQALYDKNWYAIRGPGGTYKYLPWDMENVMNSQTNNRVTGATYPPTAIQPRLAKNAQYLLDFADRVNKHMVNPDGALTPSASIARLDRWTSIMNADAMCLESARWGDYRDRVHVYNSDTNVIYSWNGSWYENGARSTSSTNWHSEINRLRSAYFPVRTDNVLTQFRNAGLYPVLNAPEFLDAANDEPVATGQVSGGFQLKMSLPASPPSGTTNSGTIYYTTDGADPRVYYDTSGARTPTALTYSTPVTLNSTVTVKARTLSGTTWSALRESTFTVGNSSPRVVISEIHYRPSTGGNSREFIEILNAGNTTVDMSHWSMDGIGFLFPFGTHLAPGARLVIANNDNPSVFTAAYPSVVISGWFSGALDNNGERLTLLDRAGNVVCSVSYRDKAPWPSTPDGSGPSLELMNPGAEIDSAENWQPSAANHGSPGQPNSAAPASVFALSEFQAGAAGFVEISNVSGTAASTAAWQLRIRQTSETYSTVPIPATTLAPGALLVVNAPLDSQQGHLVLADATGRSRDGVRYGPQADGFSFSRISNVWTLAHPTPATGNSAAATGAFADLRINELLADPVAGQDDWLEIKNLASQPVVLSGLQFRMNGNLQGASALAAIHAGSHLRLFCNKSSSRGDTIALAIPAAGGTLALQKPDGTTIDSVTFGAQVADISVGRLPDGTGAFASLPYASPAAPNHGVLADVPVLNEILVKNRTGALNPWANRSAWIELRNPADAGTTLDSWSLRGIGDKPQSWSFPSGVVIPADGHLCIWADPASAASSSNGPHVNCALGIDSEFEHDYSIWGLELVTPDGRVADRVTWGIQIPDQSIGRDSSGAWKLMSDPTFGSANSVASSLGSCMQVRINEWTGSDITLASDTTGQFGELFNTSPHPVDLSGLWLGDAPSETGTRKWQFPPLSFINGTSHALLLPSTGGNDPARLNFSLSRGGEMLILSDASATLDAVGFGLSAGAGSEGRFPDGGAGVSALLPTPGGPNVPAASTPVFYQHPRSRSVAAGGMFTLRAAAYPATSWQWFRNGQPVPGATSSNITLNPITSAHDGDYQCRATYGGDSTFSQTAAITVCSNYAQLAAEKSLGPANADQDGDGTPNGIELLLGTDPLVPDRGTTFTTLESDGGNLYFLQTMRINSRAAYTALATELSPNVQSWLRSDPVETTVLSTDSNGDRTLRLKFLVPPGQPRHFLRLALDP